MRSRINAKGQEELFDIVRKKFVIATPEEKVRQTYICFLHERLQIPLLNIIVEKAIVYNRMHKRFDIMVYKHGVCKIVVECKAETIPLTENTFFQVAMYNKLLQAEYIVLFNGKEERVFKKINEKYQVCASLPMFSNL